MRKNQYFRFYPIRGRRIKKIRGYVRLKEKSEIKALNECCNDDYEDDPIFEAAYSNHPYYITYIDIIETISLHLSVLRISYKFSYNTASRELTIHLGEMLDSLIIYQLDDLITAVLNLKSERKSLIDYIRSTVCIK